MSTLTFPQASRLILSHSRPGRAYRVAVSFVTGGGFCACPGDRWERDCIHAEELRTKMAAPTTETALTQLSEEDRLALQPIPIVAQRAMFPTSDEMRAMVELSNRAPMAAGYAIPAHLDHPGKAFAVLLAGWELGMRPMTAMRHLYVVNGRTEPDAQAMMGICQANDPSIEFRWRVVTDERVEVDMFRGGRPVSTGIYTTDDQLRAEQGYRRKIQSWQKKTIKGKERSFPVFERDREGNYVLERVDGPWWTHTRLMLCYNAVRMAIKLGAPQLVNQIMASVGAGSEAMMVATQQAEQDWGNMPRLADTGDDVDIVTGDIVGQQDETPEERKSRIIRELRAEVLAQGAEMAAVQQVVGGNGINAVLSWLDVSPDRSVAQLVEEATGVHRTYTVQPGQQAFTEPPPETEYDDLPGDLGDEGEPE